MASGTGSGSVRLKNRFGIKKKAKPAFLRTTHRDTAPSGGTSRYCSWSVALKKKRSNLLTIK
ncbi:hypothetical protein ACMV5I_29655, partial [Serratia sp. T13T92]|uniref:hypothetical protein n=1 Tax=Serratia sp. T13T92 TaxID=3397496 RepID=UPI0039DFE959